MLPALSSACKRIASISGVPALPDSAGLIASIVRNVINSGVINLHELFFGLIIII